MGDMADWTLENIELDDLYDCQDFSKTCRYCNQHGLYWYQNNKGKWRFGDLNGNIHKCPINLAPEFREEKK